MPGETTPWRAQQAMGTCTRSPSPPPATPGRWEAAARRRRVHADDARGAGGDHVAPEAGALAEADGEAVTGPETRTEAAMGAASASSWLGDRALMELRADQGRAIISALVQVRSSARRSTSHYQLVAKL